MFGLIRENDNGFKATARRVAEAFYCAHGLSKEAAKHEASSQGWLSLMDSPFGFIATCAMSIQPIITNKSKTFDEITRIEKNRSNVAHAEDIWELFLEVAADQEKDAMDLFESYVGYRIPTEFGSKLDRHSLLALTDPETIKSMCAAAYSRTAV
jgi:hypothetical protein